MHIVIRDEEKHIRSTDIPADVDCIVVGSSPDCDVYLPDVRIAERHFRIRRGADAVWTLERCEIPVHTPAEFTRVYVNAIEASETHRFKHNDEVLIARFRLNLFVDDANATAPRAAVMEEVTRIREHPLPSGAIVRTDVHGDVTLAGSAAADLSEFAFGIHQCVDIASFMSVTVSEVLRCFAARQVWMGTRRHTYGRMEFVETLRADGGTTGEPHRLETYLYRCGERGQVVCCPQTEEEETESAMCVPLMGPHGSLGMLYVDNKADSTPYGVAGLDLFSAMAAVVTRHLERIIKEQIRFQEAVSAGELSFVRELQSKMDPTNVPQWDGIQLTVYCKPGLTSTGDVYDVMRLPNGLAAFICGHVTGLATKAAVAMAETRAAFRMASLHADPPHVVLRAVNWLLHDPKDPTELACAGLVMNPRTGAMQYATAGQPGLIVIGSGGDLRSLVHGSVPPVGSSREYTYTSQAGRLESGETMVLFTPGCFSVASQAGDPLGKRRFLEALSDGFGQPSSATLDGLLSDLKMFFREGRQPDDITVMILHRE